MRLQRIKLKNIRSYEEQEVVFPQGSFLLAGDIGSGKTTILLAIEYALFGLQPGQRGSALLRNGENAGEVVLDFEVDNHQITIERKLRRANKNVSNESAAITIDGERIESSTTEIKTKVLSLLSYPSEFIKKNNLLFRYTVYTPQEQMKQIILEDTETRLNILRHIFGIDKYKRIRENMAILLVYLKDESKVLQLELRALEEDKNKLLSLQSFVEGMNKKISEKEKEFKQKELRRGIIEKELKELELKIKEKENFEKEVEKTKILLAIKRENISLMLYEIQELSKNLIEIKEEFNQKKYNRLQSEIMGKRGSIEKHQNSSIEILTKMNAMVQLRESSTKKKERIFKIDICPTCLQNIPNSHKYNIINESEKELNQIKNNLLELEKQKEKTSKILENEKNELFLLEEEKAKEEIKKSRQEYIEKSKKRLEELIRSRDLLEKDRELLAAHLDSLKEEILNFSRFNNLFKIKQEELRAALIQEKNSEIVLAEHKKELELTSREITSVQKAIEIKKISKKRLEEIQELVNWLSTQLLSLLDFTERNIMIKLRAEFSRLFNNWFHILVIEGSPDVQLDESFTPLIIQGETEMDYSFLSGGERTAVALAYRLALNETINSLISQIRTRDILILDEPTEGFSEMQLERMKDVFQELHTNQLIIVSHEQKIEEFVDNILRIKKQTGVSFQELGQPLFWRL